MITNWKSYFPVQRWCQTDYSRNLLLLQSRDSGSPWRFNSLPRRPALICRYIHLLKKKTLKFFDCSRCRGAARVWRRENWRLESRLKEYKGQAAQRGGREVRSSPNNKISSFCVMNCYWTFYSSVRCVCVKLKPVKKYKCSYFSF